MMNKRDVGYRAKLRFSRWNRKVYSIFASLGREVCIGRLAIHICEMALRKSSRKGVIVNLAEAFERMVTTFEEYAEKVTRACCPVVPARVDAINTGSYGNYDTRMKVRPAVKVDVPFLLKTN